MERTKVQKLAQVLRVLVIVVFVCNIVALVFVPGAVALFQDGGYETISKVIMGALDLPGYEGVGLKSVPLFFVMAVWYVWMDAYTAVLTLFLWACGICTAIILWQGKRVLDTIMKGEPFTLANAANLSPEELDGCDHLISSSPEELADRLMTLLWDFPLKICGGCCGTNQQHMHRFAEMLAYRRDNKAW